jgi:hypothetical protein
MKQAINKPKTNHGAKALFAEGGTTMATKGKFPFALFEKGGKDKKEAAGKKPQKFAKGGGIEVKGKTKGTMVTMKKGGKC